MNPPHRLPQQTNAAALSSRRRSVFPCRPPSLPPSLRPSVRRATKPSRRLVVDGGAHAKHTGRPVGRPSSPRRLSAGGRARILIVLQNSIENGLTNGAVDGASTELTSVDPSVREGVRVGQSGHRRRNRSTALNQISPKVSAGVIMHGLCNRERVIELAVWAFPRPPTKHNLEVTN